jgi:hypothetical protein
MDEQRMTVFGALKVKKKEKKEKALLNGALSVL